MRLMQRLETKKGTKHFGFLLFAILLPCLLSTSMVIGKANGSVEVVSGLTKSDTVQQLVPKDKWSKVQYVGGRGVFLLGENLKHLDQGVHMMYGFEYFPIPAFENSVLEKADQQYFQFYAKNYFEDTPRFNMLYSKRQIGVSCGTEFCVSFGFNLDSLIVQDMSSKEYKCLEVYQNFSLGMFKLELFLDRYAILYSDIINTNTGQYDRYVDVFDAKTGTKVLRYEVRQTDLVLNMAAYGESLYLLMGHNIKGIGDRELGRRDYEIVALEYRYDKVANSGAFIPVLDFNRGIAAIF